MSEQISELILALHKRSKKFAALNKEIDATIDCAAAYFLAEFTNDSNKKRYFDSWQSQYQDVTNGKQRNDDSSVVKLQTLLNKIQETS